MELRGSTALSTGAAGGLGQAIARELAARGCTCVLSGRNTAGLERLAAEIGGEVVVADLLDPRDVDRLIDRAAEVDILVCNAGNGGDCSLQEETSDHINELLDVNLRVPMVMASQFAQDKLTTGEPARIVLIGSLAGLAASPNTRLYNATKFGLRGFGLALAQDLDGTNVSASVVAPGFIRDAGMFADGDIDLPKAVRTKAPHDVALGVVRAIEGNQPEVFVAPTELRLSATLATVAPALSARIQKWAGVQDRKGSNSM